MLRDNHGRRIDYLRLSVTDRCDMRCAYCMPEGFKGYEEAAHWLSFDEIERVVAAFARLGVQRVRLTWGEPLLRRDLAGLARRLSALPGISDLSLSTNATQLTRQAEALRGAGIARLNVSLDSLDRDRFAAITKRDALPAVLNGLAAAKAAGFSPIKINTVVMAGVNDQEIDAMADFCIERGFVLRLIETMPVGSTGRSAGFMALGPIQERLRERLGLVHGLIPGGGPARYLISPDGRFSLGFITPLSQHFCETCNRVRMGVDGMLYPCLGDNGRVDLRSLLRGGCSERELETALVKGVRLKPLRHDFLEVPEKIVRFMSSTGG
ncbi:MAG: GTP 3',8-cyclase MoaA [Gammaproteobacteria bacterium]|nr:GTP 3',8-cyclase MoaA [Gammaproteobacteria bacterium]MBU1654900.1 GTP 3',8-cyclase MoaA [Gammaproteobacteria bacterium]MBU1960591.1 GTP 3',8-cyclase MoaA [Gammaproteobacteria bacterium]